MEDAQIINLYWERSEDAIAETACKYGNYCYYIAYNILHSNEDSEECVNDTYLKAWKSIPPYRPNSLPSFLGKITRNLSLNRADYKKAEKRNSGQTIYALDEFAECVTTSNEIDKVVNRDAVVSIFNDFLGSLSKRNRMVFVRRYWYFSSIAEIAKEYGLSEINTKVILLRCRDKLRIKLEKEGVFM